MSEGEKLKKWLKINNISQEKAASKLGIVRQTLSIYLGKYKLDDEFLQNVKTNLGFDLRESASNDDAQMLENGNIYGISREELIKEIEQLKNLVIELYQRCDRYLMEIDDLKKKIGK